MIRVFKRFFGNIVKDFTICFDCWSWYQFVYEGFIVKKENVEKGECLLCSSKTL